jgi:hypothetical protein
MYHSCNQLGRHMGSGSGSGTGGESSSSGGSALVWPSNILLVALLLGVPDRALTDTIRRPECDHREDQHSVPLYATFTYLPLFLQLPGLAP